MKTTFVLKDEVVRQAKKRAAVLGMTLSAFTEQSIRDALDAKAAVREKPFAFRTWGDARKKTAISVADLKTLMNDDLESR